MVMGDVTAEPAAGAGIPVWVWIVGAALLIAGAVWLAR